MSPCARSSVALLTTWAVVVAAPAPAGAKFTCQQRGARPDGIELRGLPAQPIARRTYNLTVTRPTVEGGNATPYLGIGYCGKPILQQAPEPTGGWFRPARGKSRGAFTVELRFAHPGRWAVSFMDLDGTFHDFGLLRIKPRTTPTKAAEATSFLPRALPTAWLGAGAASLAIAAGLILAAWYTGRAGAVPWDSKARFDRTEE